MTEKWMGITVSGDKLSIVTLEYDNESIIAVDEMTWQLQKGEARPAGYRFMLERVCNYVTEKAIQIVVIKGSSVARQGMSRAHLVTAELRGVVMAATAQPGVAVKVLDKGVVSKTFGKRKVDEYLDDDTFWAEHLDNQVTIKKGSREAALFVLAARKQ